jgi:hypothetical protein
MKGADLRHIASLVKLNIPMDHLSEYFTTPNHCFSDGISMAELTRLFDVITTGIPPADPAAELFKLYLTTGFLLYPGRRPASLNQWISRHVQPERLFPNWKTLVRGRWQSVPLLLTHRGAGHLRFLIIGIIPAVDPCPLWPGWADNLMDAVAKQGLRHATAAATTIHQLSKEHSLFAYPLMAPHPHARIKDGSLALPAALGFLSVLSKTPMPDGLTATGGIGPEGVVTKISGLEEKIGLAQTSPYAVKGLIYPLDNGLRVNDGPSGLLPVADVRQAWMFTRLFSPEKTESLVLFSRMLKAPDQFVRNVASMPAQWVNWAVKNKQVRPVIARIIKDPVLFSELAGRFEQAVYQGETTIAAAVSALLPFKDLRAASAAWPLLVFKWCGAGLSMCNHTGQTTAADQWVRAAQKLLPAVRKADIADVAGFLNHYLVARHNRYDFHPEISAELKELVSLLKNQHHMQCASGCTTFPVLGKIHGTLAQNFAFCGPRFLAETETCVRLAKIALGEGAVPEYDAEWRRQNNYLCYALLDAGSGNHNRARRALFDYLAVTRWDHVFKKLPDFTQWQHALLARFLADVPLEKQQKRYVEWTSSAGLNPDSYHPWQLWCFNMGRLSILMDQKNKAREYFSRSLGICMSAGLGPTVRVMGLLGLSGRYHLDKIIDSDHMSDYATIRETAIKLNPEHFAILELENLHAVLNKIWRQPALFFQFNYH